MSRAQLLPSLLAGLVALTALPACAGDGDGRPALAIMGTIPVYWGESDAIGDLLNGKAQTHWARPELEKTYRLVPLSYLDDSALDAFAFLLLAQPRALSGEENVALDAWVRRGGHLLLFADPMMTGESRYPIGDRRRPQDVAMLSPILDHWGLRLELHEDEDRRRTTADAGGIELPVELPGRFALVPGEADCTLSTTAVLAQCRVGDGTAVLVADATVLDLAPQNDSVRALEALVWLAFGKSGENAGKGADSASAD